MGAVTAGPPELQAQVVEWVLAGVRADWSSPGWQAHLAGPQAFMAQYIRLESDGAGGYQVRAAGGGAGLSMPLVLRPAGLCCARSWPCTHARVERWPQRWADTAPRRCRHHRRRGARASAGSCTTSATWWSAASAPSRLWPPLAAHTRCRRTQARGGGACWASAGRWKGPCAALDLACTGGLPATCSTCSYRCCFPTPTPKPKPTPRVCAEWAVPQMLRMVACVHALYSSAGRAALAPIVAALDMAPQERALYLRRGPIGKAAAKVGPAGWGCAGGAALAGPDVGQGIV